jgi:phosphoribosylformylglycinamidine cyclo-ligase
MSWLQQLGGIEQDEMDRVFNMGIGMALVFNPHYEAPIRRILEGCGLPAWKVGEIIAGEQGIQWKA